MKSRQLLYSFLADVQRIPRWGAVAGVGLGLVAVAWADRWLLPSYSLALFYLLPVLLSTFRLGRVAGHLTAVTAALLERLVFAPSGEPLAISLWNVGNRMVSLSLVVWLIDTLISSVLAEREVGQLDPLTGLLNRRAFTERAEVELERSRRSGKPVAILYLDWDNFKLVNDTQGHAAGDDLLRVIAQALRESVRATDLVARMGGDEFTLLLPETEEEQASSVAASLESRLKEHLAAGVLTGSASTGVAVFLKPPESVERMVSTADQLMLEVKSSTKGRVNVRVFAAAPQNVSHAS